MSPPMILPSLLLSVLLSRAAAIQPEVINLKKSGESVVLESPQFPKPYKMWPRPKFWQIRWSLQAPAHLQILFSDLRLHPDSRLELYDGDLPAFRLTSTARLLVRYESGADSWRRRALTADSGVLTVLFVPVSKPYLDGSVTRWLGRKNEANQSDTDQLLIGNADYEGFRLEIKLIHYASSAWLERPWCDCGWLRYTADSVSVLGTAWPHFDCVWVLRPPAGTKAWVRLMSQKLIKDSYHYDMEVRNGGTSAGRRVGYVTSAMSWQPERSFASSGPLYIRLRGNFSDSANHLVLQYHFFSIESEAAAFKSASSMPDCSRLSPGFESCPKLRLCVLPVCYKLDELSACGSDVNCSRGPAALRSCLLRLDSLDGELGGLRPRTLCRDGLRCVPLSVACPARSDQLAWRPRAGFEHSLDSAGSDSAGPASSSSFPPSASSSSSASLNVVASLGGVSLAAVALIGLGFVVLTYRSRRRRRRQHQLLQLQQQQQQQRHHRPTAGEQQAPQEEAAVEFFATTRHPLTNLSPPPPPQTPPPAYSEVVGAGGRRARTGQSPPKPPSLAAAATATTAAATAAASSNSAANNGGVDSNGQHRHRHSRHRFSTPVSAVIASEASSHSRRPSSGQPDSRAEGGSQFDQPQTVRLPPLHGAC